MARVFVSFAVEDADLRNLLFGQKQNPRSPIEFVDYSVKEAWSRAWKTNCRERIRRCRGMIGIITLNTPRADGQLWELKCAIDENIPLLLIHGRSSTAMRLSRLPSIIGGFTIHSWSQSIIVRFLERL